MMTNTVQIILSLLTLLLLSVVTHLVSRRLRVPYTVLLVAVGLLLVPVVRLPAFSYITSFQLTPDILFFIFLPILIFESAYGMNVRRIGENILAISILAVLGLIISALLIGIAGYWALGAVGLAVPFVVVLLFGALISATDPVAILALFKEFGAPARLTLIFEGESLFNDATALALFLVVLEAMTAGFHGATSVLHGVFIFFSMLAGGIAFGFFTGWLCTRLLHHARHDHLQLTITMLAAHATFLAAEFVSRTLVVAGEPVHVSSIMATLIASIVIGTRGRFKISPLLQTYLERFWSYSAFVANSLVFILLGLLFSTLPLNLGDLAPALLVIIIVVIVARGLSVYGSLGLLNATGLEQRVPRSWQHLIAWGSLRGALAVTMVLLIPDSLSLADWKQPYSIKEFILALTIGCIYFTLFIKATTMNAVMRRFHIGELRGLERMEYLEGKVYVYARTLLRLPALREQTHVDRNTFQALHDRYERRYREAFDEFAQTVQGSGATFARVLRVHAIGIEKRALKELFDGGELSEAGYRKVLGKLEQQSGAIELGRRDALDFRRARPRAPARWLRWLDDLLSPEYGGGQELPRERYLYYRALVISAARVVNLLSQLAARPESRVFESDEIFARVVDQYREYKADAAAKAKQLLAQHPELAEEQLRLLEHEVEKSQARSLEELEADEVIAPAVKSALFGEICRK
jgi:monovalent cation:H+ antiporter, CPA1 family